MPEVKIIATVDNANQAFVRPATAKRVLGGLKRILGDSHG